MTSDHDEPGRTPLSPAENVFVWVALVLFSMFDALLIWWVVFA